MKRAIVFGAGGTGRRVYEMVKSTDTVIAFVDNDVEKAGGVYDGIPIYTPELLKSESYDVIYLGTLMGYNEVQKQLQLLGIPIEKFDKTYVEISVRSRIMFIKRLSERFRKEDICGSVAEAGVFRGEFAKEINLYFFDRKCYLFDTFSGFDERDFKFEEKPSMTEDALHLQETSENIVYNKMPYKENIEIRKGYFPETIKGIEDIFAFVNLDMDLYQPTIEGLRFFYPKMSVGGIILIHDYFTEIYPNIEKAVSDFEKEIGLRLCKMPIGDDISLAIMRV